MKNDGTVWGWGAGGNGQLGNNSSNDSTSPVQAANLSSVISIACGTKHSLALKSDGTVWAWGDNYLNQLGNGSILGGSNSPSQVPNLSGICALGAGPETNSSLVAKSDGSFWGWGSNNNGQLGSGGNGNGAYAVQALMPQ